MVVALRAVRVLLPWGVLTEPQGRAGKKGSLWEPFLLRANTSKTSNACCISKPKAFASSRKTSVRYALPAFNAARRSANCAAHSDTGIKLGSERTTRSVCAQMASSS